MKLRTAFVLTPAVLGLIVGPTYGQIPLGTAFTYEGHLEEGGSPVNDTCAFAFSLWNDPVLIDTVANQVGDTLVFDGVLGNPAPIAVVDGNFLATLDFGAEVFNGDARWVEISVACPTGGGLTVLSPRQPLTPVPYALQTRGLFVDDAGNVGIGTNSPTVRLHVFDATPETNVVQIDVSGDDATGLSVDATGDSSVGVAVFATDTAVFGSASFNGAAFSATGATGIAVRGNANATGPGVANHGGFFIAGGEDGRGVFGWASATTGTNFGVYGQSDSPDGFAGYFQGAVRTETLEITGGSPVEQALAGWGGNVEGQINVPPGTFAVVAAGPFHSLAIRSDGTLAGWGLNGSGQTDVPAGTFAAVAVGGSHSLAIRSNGTLAGWGNNFEGQIDVPPGTFTALASGISHGLAIRSSDGTLAGWGNNEFGKIDVPTGTFIAVAGGGSHSLAIRSSDGTLVGWGSNFRGETDVPTGTFTAVAAGGNHSLAIRSDGTLVGWGRNLEGQTTVPTGTFTAVAARASHSLAIRSDGILFGWGDNTDGQTDVPTGAFTAVAAGTTHGLAIRRDPTPGGFGLHLDTDSAIKPGTNTWTILSDRRLKKKIRPLSGALERLMQLRGVTFEWIDPESHGSGRGGNIGLIADEVEGVFPQWVGRDPQGYRTLTIGGFEALTTEALRELRAEKDAQLSQSDAKIKKLEQRNADLTARLERLEALMADK